MGRIQKTVFISYRRSVSAGWARSVFSELTRRGYDVFFDYTGIASGDFEQIILENIHSRAHFVLLLGPHSLDRCDQPNDWLRREIETAISLKRNIIPLTFEGFSFSDPAVQSRLVGTLALLPRYNALPVPNAYFDAAMLRLHKEVLRKPVDAVRHPLSPEAQAATIREQQAAAQAISQTATTRSTGGLTRRNVIQIGAAIATPLAILELVRIAASSRSETQVPQGASTDTAPPHSPQAVSAATPKPEASNVKKLAWASDQGQDQYGRWAEIEIKGVVQRLRWIEPGEFLMGSPQSEAYRNSDEGPQHKVTLSRGYWLADTACTQALWQAVMGSNPSGFKDDSQNPVERVSWNDVQDFLSKLQSQLPDCQLSLPTEAQWEYACRAGTQTPFFFGETINTDQVNYNGNYPYGKGKIGEYRNKTVPVKALPANAWGLYQMHGNVWEWCRDGMRTYASQAVVDPCGPEGPDRILRGGTWFYPAQVCRSAYRLWGRPWGRVSYIGFRLAWVPRSGSKPG